MISYFVYYLTHPGAQVVARFIQAWRFSGNAQIPCVHRIFTVMHTEQENREHDIYRYTVLFRSIRPGVGHGTRVAEILALANLKIPWDKCKISARTCPEFGLPAEILNIWPIFWPFSDGHRRWDAGQPTDFGHGSKFGNWKLRQRVRRSQCGGYPGRPPGRSRTIEPRRLHCYDDNISSLFQKCGWPVTKGFIF